MSDDILKLYVIRDSQTGEFWGGSPSLHYFGKIKTAKVYATLGRAKNAVGYHSFNPDRIQIVELNAVEVGTIRHEPRMMKEPYPGRTVSVSKHDSRYLTTSWT